VTRNFALPGRSPVHASESAVATSHPLATSTALNILREGGNAVDAAIAASATLCVVEPHMTGIGGDCFAIVGEPDGKLHGLNGSGRSASGCNLDWYLENGFNKIEEQSAHAVTAPGALRAWEALHNRFGSTDFVRLFADAIHYGTEGFPVGSRVAADWQLLVEKLSANPGANAHYLFNKKAPAAGQKITSPALAETLKQVASQGVDAFYEGEIACEIADTIKAGGGILSEADIAATQPDWVTPISADFNGHQLHEIPPNGQGLAALILTKLLKKIGTAESHDSLERAHLEAECGRIAYTARDAYIADPATMHHSIETLLSDSHIDDLAKLFSPNARNETLALPDPTGSDTVYLTVVDRNGLAISFINSLFGGFGSGIVTPKSGITLQNRGCGFNLIKGHANAIGPSKRPFHTIIPAMVTKNGRITHSYGVMGGSYQSMGHAHVLSNMLDYEMDPQQALDNPRIFWDSDGLLALEAGIPEAIETGLANLGHACIRGAVHGGGQIIQINHETGTLIAGSDPRKDGNAAGI